jgi:hypothetical protein
MSQKGVAVSQVLKDTWEGLQKKTAEWLTTYIWCIIGPLLAGTLAAIPRIADYLISSIPPRILLVIASSGLAGTIVTIACLFVLRRNYRATLVERDKLIKNLNESSEKRRYRFGANWDNENNPRCIECDTVLRPDTVKSQVSHWIQTPLDSPPELNCVRCGTRLPLVDDNGTRISLPQAKKLLAR